MSRDAGEGSQANNIRHPSSFWKYDLVRAHSKLVWQDGRIGRVCCCISGVHNPRAGESSVGISHRRLQRVRASMNGTPAGTLSDLLNLSAYLQLAASSPTESHKAESAAGRAARAAASGAPEGDASLRRGWDSSFIVSVASCFCFLP